MSNRRKDPRIHVDEPLEMLLLEPDRKNITIAIDEISFSGLRFKSEVELPLEQEMIFIIPGLDPGQIMKGSIVWQKKLEAGYFYGFEITRS